MSLCALHRAGSNAPLRRPVRRAALAMLGIGVLFFVASRKLFVAWLVPGVPPPGPFG